MCWYIDPCVSQLVCKASVPYIGGAQVVVPPSFSNNWSNLGFVEWISYSGTHVYIILYNVCSVHRGDIMSTSGGYHDACGEYHEYIRGCSVHKGFQHKSVNLLPHMNHDIPRCTEHLPMCSRYPPI